MALLRHVHLPYSVASYEKLLETNHGLETGVPRGVAIAVERSDRGGKVWNVTPLVYLSESVGVYAGRPRREVR